jgi:nucleoside-diphosphate-sugar epimerase
VEKRVLVTGASVFVGMHLVEKLLCRKDVCELAGVSRSPTQFSSDRYIPVQQDLRHEEPVKMLLKFFKPHLIIHLAGNPITKKDADNPSGVIDTNIKSTKILLDWMPEYSSMVYISSATVYGDTSKSAIETDCPNPTSDYAVTKLASEFFCKASERNFCIIRPVAVVGSGATHGIIPDLIRKVNAAEPTMRVFGTAPGCTKPFVHVSDLITAIEFLGFTNKRGIYNVSAGDSINVENIAETVFEVLGIRKELEWDADAVWHGDNKQVLVSNGKLLALGWRPIYASSKDAITRAIINITGAPQC